MRVPEWVRRSVTFLTLPESSGGACIATAFIVGVPYGDGTQDALHLVTVRHTADTLEGKAFGIRANTAAGAAQTYWADEDSEWFRHPTDPDRVDAAVYPLFGSAHSHGFERDDGPNVRPIPVEMFLSDSDRASAGIGPGDAVFIAGMFTRLPTTRIEPIIRTGNIAAMPRDPIPNVNICQRAVDAEMHLIEVRSMGGLSGSPVFVRETVGLEQHARSSEWKKGELVNLACAGPFYFLGMMQGHWNIHPAEHDNYAFHASKETDRSIALGLSLAVPARKILEVLNHPELVAMREELERRRREEQGTTSYE